MLWQRKKIYHLYTIKIILYIYNRCWTPWARFSSNIEPSLLKFWLRLCLHLINMGHYGVIGMYIWLQSHPALSLEERSRLCRCLNYEKLSLEACKDLAKNPRISPRIAVKALASQSCSTIPTIKDNNSQLVLYKTNKSDHQSSSTSSDHQSLQEEEHEYMRLHLQKMQWRVVELEKICKDMKGQMTKMVKNGTHTKALPRLCRSQYFWKKQEKKYMFIIHM